MAVKMCLTLCGVYGLPVRHIQGLMCSIAKVLYLEIPLPDLIAEMDADVSRFLADGSHDGQGVVDRLEDRFGSGTEIVISRPKSAVRGENARRNRYIAAIAEYGRMNWQIETEYNQRSQVEAQIGRWKQAIGDRLQARGFDCLIAEAKVASKVLDQMTGLGRAKYRPYWCASSVISATRRSSSTRPCDIRRCVKRCWPRTRQTRRSKTFIRLRTRSMQARRREELRSFTWRPPTGSICPKSGQKQHALTACFLSEAASVP